MPKGYPINAETRDQAIALMREGRSRNSIARELGISGGSVGNIATDVGHLFDWSQTELATRARTIQAQQIRTDLALMAFVRGREALEQMSEPALMVHYQAATEHETGGWKEHAIPAPTSADQRNLATVFGIMMEKATLLSRVTAGAVDGEATSALSELARVMAIAADAFDGASDPTTEPVNISRQQMIEDLQADDAHDSTDSPTSDQD